MIAEKSSVYSCKVAKGKLLSTHLLAEDVKIREPHWSMRQPFLDENKKKWKEKEEKSYTIVSLYKTHPEEQCVSTCLTWHVFLHILCSRTAGRQRGKNHHKKVTLWVWGPPELPWLPLRVCITLPISRRYFSWWWCSKLLTKILYTLVFQFYIECCIFESQLH